MRANSSRQIVLGIDTAYNIAFKIVSLFDSATRDNAFLVQIIDISSETLAIVNKVKLKSVPDFAISKDLKDSWSAIATSRRFLIPGRQRSELKRLCSLVCREVVKLNSCPSQEQLETISRLLGIIIEKTEQLQHGDPTYLVKPAISSTLSLIDRLLEQSPSKTYAHSDNLPNPISLWTEIRLVSMPTNKIIYQHSDAILKLCNQILSAEKAEQELLISQLREETKLIQSYLSQKHSEKLMFYVKLGLSPIAIILLCSGLINFTPVNKFHLSEEDKMTSDGDAILIPDKDIHSNQMNQLCSARRNLKKQATDSFRVNKKLAISYMQAYLKLCPEDAEAQVYLNNYRALASFQNNSGNRPLVKLAVVIPLLRDNGINDSFEVLRGISLAQYKSNLDQTDSNRPNPLLLVKIVNEGLSKFTQVPLENNGKIEMKTSNTEYAKGIMAVLAAKSIASVSSNEKSNPAVVGVVGHFSSGSTEAASKTYNLYNIPVISPTSTNLRKLIDPSRYSFNGVSAMHSIVALVPSYIAETFMSNYGTFRYLLDTYVFRRSPIQEGLLDLDPNIYRMPPTDDMAQQLIIDYVDAYNFANQNHKVKKIIVISEASDTSKYSRNYLISMKKILEGSNGNKYDAPIYKSCMFYPKNSNFENEKECRSEILNNPEESKLLILAPSSSGVERSLKFVKSIINDNKRRENLIIAGADSLLSAFHRSKIEEIFAGTIITSASKEGNELFPLSSNINNTKSGKPMRLTWRSQMAHDSVIVFREHLKNALRSGYQANDVRKLRSYLVRSIVSGVTVNKMLSNEESVVKFKEDSHDRDIDKNGTMNILLCIEKNANGRIVFRELKDPSRAHLCHVSAHPSIPATSNR